MQLRCRYGQALGSSDVLAPDDPDVIFNLALSDDRLQRPADATRLYWRYLEHAPPGRARDLAEQRLRRLSAPPP